MIGVRGSIVMAMQMVALGASAGGAQTPGSAPRAPTLRIWSLKRAPAPYVSPNRAHWSLPAILAAHAGMKSWTQLLVRDADGLSASYVQMAPGEKTRTMLYVDSSIFWVVQSGVIRFDIEGQEPFSASKGFIVHVPERVAFSMEAVGDAPSLRFEVTHSRATPAFPIGEKPPPAPPGQTYVHVAFAGGPGGYGNSPPYLDFDKDVVRGGGRPPNGFVRDGETSANLIRGPGVPRPPDRDPGHFHDGTSEFWFVLEGHLSVLIEGVPFIDAAGQGDVIYAPAGRWHRTSFAGDGMSTRISIHPLAEALNLLDPELSGIAAH